MTVYSFVTVTRENDWVTLCDTFVGKYKQLSSIDVIFEFKSLGVSLPFSRK